MKVLQLHCDFIEYEPVKKEIKMAEETVRSKNRYNDVVVVFVTIEEGDDENAAHNMVEETKTSLQRLGSDNLLIHMALK